MLWLIRRYTSNFAAMNFALIAASVEQMWVTRVRRNMSLQRKIFRIEQMHPATMPAAMLAEAGAALPHQEILCELQALRDLIERRCSSSAEPGAMDDAIGRTKLEIAALHVGPVQGGPARATRELDAIVEGAERATQKIINAAEEIEDAANTLSACPRTGRSRRSRRTFWIM
jgi:hypothetical protein